MICHCTGLCTIWQYYISQIALSLWYFWPILQISSLLLYWTYSIKVVKPCQVLKVCSLWVSENERPVMQFCRTTCMRSAVSIFGNDPWTRFYIWVSTLVLPCNSDSPIGHGDWRTRDQVLKVQVQVSSNPWAFHLGKSGAGGLLEINDER